MDTNQITQDSGDPPPPTSTENQGSEVAADLPGSSSANIKSDSNSDDDTRSTNYDEIQPAIKQPPKKITRSMTKRRRESVDKNKVTKLKKKDIGPKEKEPKDCSKKKELSDEIKPNELPSQSNELKLISGDFIDSDTDIIKELDSKNFEAARLKLRSCAKEANRLEIYWVKVKSYNFWPAQRVIISETLKKKKIYQQVLKSRTKDQDECFMFFGTSQIAYVNSKIAVVSWIDGLEEERRFIEKGLSRPFFKASLEDVYSTCTRLHYYSVNWWREPKWHVLLREFKGMVHVIEELKQSRKFSSLDKDIRTIFERASREQIYWSTKVEMEDPWLVQVVPRHIFFRKYPIAREVERRQNLRDSHLPCRHFGNGKYGFVPIGSMTTYIGGLLRGFHEIYDTKNYIYHTHPKKVQHQDFLIALGEVWGYLQTPRYWPGGNDGTMSWWCENPVQELGQEISKQPWREISTYFVPEYTHITDMKLKIRSFDSPDPDTDSNYERCDCIPNKYGDKCFDSTCSRRGAGNFCDKECSSQGPCLNQSPTNTKFPRVQPFLTSDGRGWGLRVEQDVKRGEVVILYIGELIDRSDYASRQMAFMEHDDLINEMKYEDFVLDLGEGHFIDSSIKSNECRFINLSCEANCKLEWRQDLGLGKEYVVVVSKIGIPKGTELTIMYSGTNSFKFVGEGIFASCICGTGSCVELGVKEAGVAKILIGKQIKMKWDCDFYDGKVTQYLHKEKMFRIEYMDGDSEVINLQYGGPDHPDNNFEADAETATKLDNFLQYNGNINFGYYSP